MYIYKNFIFLRNKYYELLKMNVEDNNDDLIDDLINIVQTDDQVTKF